MNLELYDKLMEQGSPHQYSPEWLIFLEICEMYLKKHEIKNPVVVELGIERDKQKMFYEQLLGAEHIGIDIKSKRCVPDVHGDTHDPKTLEMLKKKLKGRSIDILFIDAGHCYESVKKDFEMYAPLCKDIIAFHDIETYQYKNKTRVEVWKFWDELRMRVYEGIEGYKNLLLLSIHQYRGVEDKSQMGIGVMIRK